jgi:hypothetical protein
LMRCTLCLWLYEWWYRAVVVAHGARVTAHPAGILCFLPLPSASHPMCRQYCCQRALCGCGTLQPPPVWCRVWTSRHPQQQRSPIAGFAYRPWSRSGVGPLVPLVPRCPRTMLCLLLEYMEFASLLLLMHSQTYTLCSCELDESMKQGTPASAGHTGFATLWASLPFHSWMCDL